MISAKDLFLGGAESGLTGRLTSGLDSGVPPGLFTPLPEDGPAEFRTVEAESSAEGRWFSTDLSLETPTDRSVGRDETPNELSFDRDDPSAGDSIREALVGASRSSSTALRLGAASAGREIVVGDGVGESPLIDASKSEI